ncbi:calcium-binding protein [Qipengyuania citrea]|jgi:hypothetical protein|uniref:calcium-binding protein n=1 Tax=Qipengyuania citrea TaxID=225971 RepID=UPI001E3F453E|nr:calcium-binding protein [Qipengyuania citrea]MCD1589198.1 calcium-binding protein [Qipengyuania citrea]MCZ4263954.1 calcium-binding protein [Erythrobacter sp. G21629-S1]
MNKTILALSAAALALTGTTAIAQHRGAHNPDTDGNGSVTLTEMQAASAERFARMDANGDGVINAADSQARGAQMFARADANGDGELTAAEMQAAREARKADRPERGERSERRAKRGGDRTERMAQRFAQADTDNSGGLSQAELAAMHEARGERGKRGNRGGKRGGMFLSADANGDQAISRAEFDAAVQARFAKLDSDGNGAISAEEREAHKAERRAERQAKRGERRGQ